MTESDAPVPSEPPAEYVQYRRTAVAEMADWHPGFDMTRVSVSPEDHKAGSPRAGDKIVRNPANHADQWLVAAEYFAANFEPIRQPPAPDPVPDALREEAERLVPMLEKEASLWNVIAAGGGARAMNDVAARTVSDAMRASAAIVNELLASLTASPAPDPLREAIRHIESGVVPGQMGYYVPQADWDALVKLALTPAAPATGEPPAALRREPDAWIVRGERTLLTRNEAEHRAMAGFRDQIAVYFHAPSASTRPADGAEPREPEVDNG